MKSINTLIRRWSFTLASFASCALEREKKNPTLYPLEISTILVLSFKDESSSERLWVYKIFDDFVILFIDRNLFENIQIL